MLNKEYHKRPQKNNVKTGEEQILSKHHTLCTYQGKSLMWSTHLLLVIGIKSIEHHCPNRRLGLEENFGFPQGFIQKKVS